MKFAANDEALNGETAAPPRWKLDALYSGARDPQLMEDLRQLTHDALSVQARYQGRVVRLSADALADLIAQSETIMMRLAQVEAFGYLNHATRMDDQSAGALLQNIREKTSTIQKHLLFVSLELKRFPADHPIFVEPADHEAEGEFSEKLERYRFFLKRIDAFRPFTLSDDLEEYLEEASAVMDQAWIRLYDENRDAMRFVDGGSTWTLSEVLHRVSSADRDVRYRSAELLGQGLAREKRQSSSILNTLIRQKAIVDQHRHYPTPEHERYLLDNIEQDCVDALIASVQEAAPRLAQRYFRLKALWLTGTSVLDYRDRLAPVPGSDRKQYSWHEGVDLVLKAFGDFAPWMRQMAEQVIASGHVDAEPRVGKSPGGFMYPTPPGIQPFLLVNYRGRSRDVMVLSHELGHAVHQGLASRKQGYFGAATPLTLAETASVFGEMLTFRRLLGQTSTPGERLGLLATKVESMLLTVVAQISYHDFERRIHKARAEGELSPDQINAFWLEATRRAYGDAIQFDPDVFGHYWAYVMHFFHSPFYVYSYAFGECMVASLYGLYDKGFAGFEDALKTILSSGGVLHHRELFKPLGIDVRQQEFWRHGVEVIVGMIDEVESLLRDSGVRVDDGLEGPLRKTAVEEIV